MSKSPLREKAKEFAKQIVILCRDIKATQRTDAHAFYHCCGYSGDKEQVNLTKMF